MSFVYFLITIVKSTSGVLVAAKGSQEVEKGVMVSSAGVEIP